MYGRNARQVLYRCLGDDVQSSRSLRQRSVTFANRWWTPAVRVASGWTRNEASTSGVIADLSFSVAAAAAAVAEVESNCSICCCCYFCCFFCCWWLFMPPPNVAWPEAYCFLSRSSVRACMRPCVHTETLLTWFHAEYLTYFRQTCIKYALWDRDKCFTVWGSKDQRSRSQWNKGCCKQHFLGLLTQSLEKYLSSFRQTYTNDGTEMTALNFGFRRSKFKVVLE